MAWWSTLWCATLGPAGALSAAAAATARPGGGVQVAAAALMAADGHSHDPCRLASVLERLAAR